MKTLALKYKKHFSNKDFLKSLLWGILFFAFSLLINFYAGKYATERASNSVADLILNNIPVFNVYYVFVYGPILFWTFLGVFCFWDLKRIPFTLKSIALFVVIRSLFISLTHLGLPHPQTFVGDGWAEKFISGPGGDLFFSSHTGLPFLMALIFWQQKYVRAAALGASFIFGATVLLGHLHYSIDVLSAFFITYTIYCLALDLFKKDRQIFLYPHTIPEYPVALPRG